MSGGGAALPPDYKRFATPRDYRRIPLLFDSVFEAAVLGGLALKMIMAFFHFLNLMRTEPALVSAGGK